MIVWTRITPAPPATWTRFSDDGSLAGAVSPPSAMDHIAALVGTPGPGFNSYTVDAANGSDSNPGTGDEPFATLAKAIAACTRGDNSVIGEIIMRGGDYDRPHLPLGDANSGGQAYVKHLIIRAAPEERVRWIAGTAVSGASWSKTATYTNVYEAAYASMDADQKFIFEHDVGEGVIPIGERHSLHRGEVYRVPWAKRLRRVSTIADCDATAATWTHASGKIYIHAPGSTNPITSGITYRIPDNASPTNIEESAVNYAVSGKTGHFEMHGITVMYYYRGFHLADVASYVLDDVTAVGCVKAGFMNSRSHGIERRCRAMSIGEDGFQGFGSAANEAADYRNMSVIREHLYAVYCGDDGVTDHYRSEAYMVGGLSEYNDDAGIVPAAGAHNIAIGSMVRFNGQEAGVVQLTGLSTPTGEGIGVRTTPAAAEDGVGTSFVGIDIISEGNAYNFRCAFADCTLDLLNCKSFSPYDVSLGSAGRHYSQGSTGRVLLIDCGYSGSGTIKGGTPTVHNTTLVT